MSRARLVLAAALCLAIAIVLRFVGYDALLPSFVEPDAHVAVQVQLIEDEHPDPSSDENYGKYPHLVAWTTMALTPTPEWGSLDADAPLEEHLALSSAHYARVRWAVALLSLLALPATWLLARLYLASGGALIATWLAATSLLALNFAAQGRPHAAAMGFFALGVASSVFVRRRGDVAAYAVASLACALCFGTLQSGIAVYFSLGMAHLLAGPLKSRRHWKLLIPAAGFGLALLCFYPFWLFGSGGEGGQVELEGTRINQAGHLIMLHAFNGKGFPLLTRALASWEPVLFVGTLLGLVMWCDDRLRRRAGKLAWPDHLVVLAFVAPYAFVISLYQRSYERFLIPLVPFLCVLSGWAFLRVARAAGRGPRALRIGVAFGLALMLALPAVVGWRLMRVRLAPSTYEQVADYVRAELDPALDTVVVSVPLVLPLFATRASLAGLPWPKHRGRGIYWLYYQVEELGSDEPRAEPAWQLAWMPMHRKDLRRQITRNPRTFVRSLDARWAVIEVFEKGRMLPFGVTLHEALRDHAELLARFGPDPDPFSSPTPLTYQDETGGSIPWFAWRLLTAERMGAVLEVYQLPGRASRGG